MQEIEKNQQPLKIVQIIYDRLNLKMQELIDLKNGAAKKVNLVIRPGTRSRTRISTDPWTTAVFISKNKRKSIFAITVAV